MGCYGLPVDAGLITACWRQRSMMASSATACGTRSSGQPRPWLHHDSPAVLALSHQGASLNLRRLSALCGVARTIPSLGPARQSHTIYVEFLCNFSDSPGFLRKCRSSLFSCGGVQATPAWTILVVKSQPIDIIGLILSLIRRKTSSKHRVDQGN
jgi:hypothetical protein